MKCHIYSNMSCVHFIFIKKWGYTKEEWIKAVAQVHLRH
jgi:hypothetical protein